MSSTRSQLDQVTRWGKLPAWWLLHPEVDADRLAVMAALTTYADEMGCCEPSQATLAKRLGRSRPWANRVIADLASIGMLRKQGRARANGGTTSCRYRLAQTPEQAEEFRAAISSEAGVPEGTAARPPEDRPRHQPDRNHADLEQIQDTRCGTRAQEAGTPEADGLDDGRAEVSRDWLPSDQAIEEALRLCPDADLDEHTTIFVSRCRAKGYRYRADRLDDAWLDWLLQDRRRMREAAARTERLAASGIQVARGARGPSAAEHHRFGRFEAWAASAAMPAVARA